MRRVKAKSPILSFCFSDVNQFKAIHRIFPNFCETSNVNYLNEKSEVYKSFFDVKKLKVTQKNEKNNVYIFIFFFF